MSHGHLDLRSLKKNDSFFSKVSVVSLDDYGLKMILKFINPASVYKIG